MGTATLRDYRNYFIAGENEQSQVQNFSKIVNQTKHNKSIVISIYNL